MIDKYISITWFYSLIHRETETSKYLLCGQCLLYSASYVQWCKYMENKKETKKQKVETLLRCVHGDTEKIREAEATSQVSLEWQYRSTVGLTGRSRADLKPTSSVHGGFLVLLRRRPRRRLRRPLKHYFCSVTLSPPCKSFGHSWWNEHDLALCTILEECQQVSESKPTPLLPILTHIAK